MIKALVKWAAGAWGEIAVVLVMCGALFSAGTWVGYTLADQAAAAQQLRDVKVHQAWFDRVTESGKKEVGELRAELKQSEEFANTLKARQPNVQIVARPARCTGAANAALAPTGPGASAPAVEPDGLYLTVGAVSLWNDALTGVAVPAGACGTPGAADGACAAESTATPDDAWANHIENATSCREDRLRFRRLSDFIKGRAD